MSGKSAQSETGSALRQCVAYLVSQDATDFLRCPLRNRDGGDPSQQDGARFSVRRRIGRETNKETHLLGWVIAIHFPSFAHPASRRNCGSCVLLPVPVGDCSTTTGCCSSKYSRASPARRARGHHQQAASGKTCRMGLTLFRDREPVPPLADCDLLDPASNSSCASSAAVLPCRVGIAVDR